MSLFSKLLQTAHKLAETLIQDDTEDFEQQDSHGVTAELLEFVNNVCDQHPRTFTDFPFSKTELLAADGFELSAAQERHAEAALKKSKALRHCRRLLCGSAMPEARFWKIYFLLVRNMLEDYYRKQSKPAPKPSPASVSDIPSSATSENIRSTHVDTAVDAADFFDSIWSAKYGTGPDATVPVSPSAGSGFDALIGSPVSPATRTDSDFLNPPSTGAEVIDLTHTPSTIDYNPFRSCKEEQEIV
eukprot:TRINITY_DN2043_c0_g1_i5.p1 TRINITY_DN2043_c0_g1~~TRINITY_DN2043_c0_g1_i5.p1  ORF type:complete len:244 (-),score=31.49 TRINITY_DN2043_c0_g1_i5:1067-1798(-)